MSVSVNKVYTICQDLIRKSQSGGYFDETVFNRYADMAQKGYYNDLYKQNESNQYSDDSLQDLDVQPIVISLNDGKGAYPSDYWHNQFLQLPYKVKNRTINVEVVQPAELAMRLSSEFIAPNEQNPVAVLKDNYLEVYPTTTPQVEMSYLREPTSPFWNYTVSSGRKVFAAASGTGVNVNAKKNVYFNTNNVDLTKNTITINRHGFHTSQAVLYDNNSGTNIGGIATTTDYFAIVVDSNTIKLASSTANALAGTALDLTTTPSGESQFFQVNAPDHSTDFEITEYDLPKIVARILALMGISVREYEITQIASGATE